MMGFIQLKGLQLSAGFVDRVRSPCFTIIGTYGQAPLVRGLGGGVGSGTYVQALQACVFFMSRDFVNFITITSI